MVCMNYSKRKVGLLLMTQINDSQNNERWVRNVTGRPVKSPVIVSRRSIRLVLDELLKHSLPGRRCLHFVFLVGV